MMGDDGFELVRGSGNVFRDLGLPHPDIQQAKAVLAAAILKTLDARGWSPVDAEAMTQVNRGAFASIRRARLGRFSIERLATILHAMGLEVELSVQVRPREPATSEPVAPRP